MERPFRYLTVSVSFGAQRHASLSPMTNTTASSIFFTDLAGRTKIAPEWVELFPAGPAITARDGRSWSLQPQIVLDAFKNNRGPLAIDWEHAQAHLAPKGFQAPAAGWIVELQEREGAVWGRVEWGAEASKQIADKAYRFLSPDFQHRSDGLITHLNGAALVNRPALEMTALSRANPKQEKPMLKAIAKALGLAETADEAAILSAVAARDTERKAICQALKIDVPQDFSDPAIISNAIAAMQDTSANALAAAQNNIPSAVAAEMTSLKKDLSVTRTALAAMEKKDHEREIDTALDKATTAGKITPAARESYRAMCSLEGGLEKFNSLVATLPVIAEPSTLGDVPAASRDEGGMSSTALAAKARQYQDEQHAAGNLISISDAVHHVKETQS